MLIVLGAAWLKRKKVEMLNSRQHLLGLVRQEAAARGVPLSLLEAIIMTESSWNTRAIHYDYSGDLPAGAVELGWRSHDWGTSFGLMQVEGSTAWALGYRGRIETGLFDPVTNIQLGLDVLTANIREYGDIFSALIAYNGGGKAVADYRLGRPTPAVEYATRVTALAAKIAAKGGSENG